MEEKPKKKYIKYTAEELAAVASPWQMERELGQVCEEHGIGMPVGDTAIEREYKLLKGLGVSGYVAQRRLEAEVRRRRHHHHHHD